MATHLRGARATTSGAGLRSCAASGGGGCAHRRSGAVAAKATGDIARDGRVTRREVGLQGVAWVGIGGWMARGGDGGWGIVGRLYALGGLEGGCGCKFCFRVACSDI